MSDQKKLRTFLLLERANLAAFKQHNKITIAIDATDEMLDGLKEKFKDRVNLQKTYYVAHGCYRDLNNGPLTTIIFLSPILAELVKLSENLRGNNFEVVEANPEILSELKFLFTDPSISEMAVSMGSLRKNKKTLFHHNGSMALNNNISLTLAELQEYMQTANLPESYLRKLEAEASHEAVYRYTETERMKWSSEDIKAISEHLFEEILLNSIQQESTTDADGILTY